MRRWWLLLKRSMCVCVCGHQGSAPGMVQYSEPLTCRMPFLTRATHRLLMHELCLLTQREGATHLFFCIYSSAFFSLSGYDTVGGGKCVKGVCVLWLYKKVQPQITSVCTSPPQLPPTSHHILLRCIFSFASFISLLLLLPSKYTHLYTLPTPTLPRSLPPSKLSPPAHLLPCSGCCCFLALSPNGAISPHWGHWAGCAELCWLELNVSPWAGCCWSHGAGQRIHLSWH